MSKLNLQKLFEYAEKKNWYIEWYPGIVEKGYDDKPTILANWNNIPSKVSKALEYNGINCDWEDEWVSCGECGKLVRTSPDCYHWQPSYIILNECEVYCLNCLKEYIEEYYQSIENSDKNAVTIPISEEYPPSDYSYTLVNEGYENGFFGGQTDNPKEILAHLLEHNPKGKFLFVLTNQGQFDIEFAVYQKIEDSENNEED